MSFEMDKVELAEAVARGDVEWLWSAYEYGKQAAYRAGQEEMRERAAVEAEEQTHRASALSKAIRALPILSGNEVDDGK